jgi:hypothetical protein
MRLGELLVEEGTVTPEQIAEGLRAQVIYGGRLGTNLIELGHASIDQVAEALGQLHHLACAYTQHFDSADGRLQRKLSPVLAAELEAIPLSEELPGVVAVAFLDPPSAEVMRRIGEALGCEIVPVIAPELRLRYQLEHVYGLPRPNRFVRIAPRHDPAPATEWDDGHLSERTKRRYVQPLSEAEPEPAALGRVALRQQRIVVGGTPAPGDGEQLDHATNMDQALAGMRRATDRDRVVDLAVSCMRNGFDQRLGVGLFLLVREEMAIGWHGFSDAGDDVVATIAIPLAEPSVLELSYKTGLLVCGKPPPNGDLIDRRLWHMLGSDPPAACVVAPIPVQDRIVCMLYAHARDLGTIPDEISHDIALLAESAGTAFLRLIRSSQR